MPRHMEQPALRHSKPASLKTRSSPSASAGRLHLHRARHDHRPHAARDALALDHAGRGAQVLEAAVGARADEDAVDRDVLQRRAGLERHVGEGALLVGRGRLRARAAVIAAVWPGFVPHETCGASDGDVDHDLAVEDRVVVRCGRRASARRPRRSRPARRGGPRGRRRSCRRARRRPARAPPSIDMLQTVMRPSIESASMAAPVYSATWPVMPAMPSWPIRPRIRSLAHDAAAGLALEAHAAASASASAAASAWPARARPRSCRCRTRARRRRRAWRCASRRRRSSCRAA